MMFIKMVDLERVELSTPSLKGSYSTIELQIQKRSSFSKTPAITDTLMRNQAISWRKVARVFFCFT